MKTQTLFVVTWTLAVTLSACAQLDFGKHPAHASDDRRHDATPALLFSPNGEPLSGGVPCGDAMSQWFGRVDGNHDDRIDRTEFLADARVQFERMDLDHNGFVTADELTAFRIPFLNKSRSDDDVAEAPRHRSRGEEDGVRPASGTDPVMSADTNLDFKVSLDEFLKQAASIFDHLDTDHDGALSPAEVHGFCPVAPQ